MSNRTLTTTSYAILGLLAVRPWPTYELAKQMRRSLHYVWPRAESNLYAEPKRLVEAGLADRHEEWNGGRKRTVYAITDAGRKALAEWLARPGDTFRFESEAALKAFFAENGTKEDLIATIRALRADAEAGLAHWSEAADDYSEGRGRFPERLHLSALVARLLGEHHATTVRWAAWAEDVVAQWEDTASPQDVDWSVGMMRDIGRAFDERLSGGS